MEDAADCGPNETAVEWSIEGTPGPPGPQGPQGPEGSGQSDLQAYCALVAANPASYWVGPCDGFRAAVDAAGFVGRDTSIALGADGNPVISYHDGSNGDLKVAHCGNPACSSGTTLTTVDAAGDVGDHTSIAIGADSHPVISYYDDRNNALKVARPPVR